MIHVVISWLFSSSGICQNPLTSSKVRKAKRNCEHKLAQNIKSDSKSFYAYVRSKQNVRDKVGPLEDNAGHIITEGCLMDEELNVHFSVHEGRY